MEEVGVKLTLDANSFYGELGKANSALDNFGSQVDSATKKAGGGFDAFEQVAIGALREVGAMLVNVAAEGAMALAGFAKDSIDAAGDFEAGLNEFAAAAGGSLEAAGLSVQDFSDLFIQMGKDLPVSTADVEKAAIALVKGGLDPAIIAAGGLESSLNFAAGAGMELEAAAELGVKMLGTFTLITDDAATKTAFLASAQDLLVKAANASTLDVAALGDAMLAAGGQANAAGLEYQDFVTAMALISPAFGSAAEAGTSFKNFLIRLNPTTKPAIEAMTNLGLYTEEAGSAFYDASGAFVGVEQSAQLLQDSLGSLTDQQRVMALQAIFGNDAMGAANALANGGAEAYRALAEQMANANGVSEQAAAVQQGLNFQMDNFMGSVEALQITIGMALMPVLTELFQNVLTPAIGVVIEMASALTGNQEAFAALSPPLQSIVLGFQQVIDVVSNVIGALMEAGPMSLEFAESFGLIDQRLPPVIRALQDAANFLQNNWQTAVTVAGTVFAAVLAPGIAAGAVAFGAAVVAAAPVIAILAAVGAAAALLKGIWDQNLGGIQEKTAAAMAAVQEVIERIMGGVMAFWEKNGADIMAFAQETWSKVQSIISGIVEIILIVVTKTMAGVQDFLDKHGSEIQAIVQFAWDTISDLISNTLDVIQGIVTTVLGIITGDWEKAGDGIMEIVGALWGFISDQFNNILGLIEGLAPGFLAAAKDVGSKVVDGIISGISSGLESIKKAAQDMAQAAMDAAKDALGIQSPSRVFALEVGEPMSQGVAKGILDAAYLVTDAIKTLSEDAAKEATKSFAAIAEAAAGAMEDALSGRLGLTRGHLGVSDYMESLISKQEEMNTQILDITAANKTLDSQIAEMQGKGGTLDSRIASLIAGGATEEDSKDLVQALREREKIAADLAKLQSERSAGGKDLDSLIATYTTTGDRDQRTYMALQEAQAQANEIAKIDAVGANEYLNLRKNQITEIAKYEQRITDATSEGAKERAQANLAAVKQAQALELEQLKNSTNKRASEIAAQGDMEATGNAVVDGIIKGIWDRSSELANALGMAMADALEAARNSLGIHSPSLVFAAQVGVPIAEGIGLGIEQAMGNPLAAINSLTNSLVRPAGPAVAGRSSGSTSINQSWNYSPSYNSAPPNPSQDFAAMRVLATAR